MRWPSNCGLAVLALLAGFGCSNDHASTQVKEDQPALGSDGSVGQASDATTGSGGSAIIGSGGVGGYDRSGEGVCDCDGETRGVSTIVVSLECVCALTGCKPHEHRSELEPVDCKANSIDPTFSYVERGCGLISTLIGTGWTTTRTVYRESDHELVGGSASTDTDWAVCRRGVYATDNTDLTKCDDYSICSPCPGPGIMHDLCPDDSADADAGM